MQNSDTYVGAAVRTDTPVTPELIARLSNPDTVRLLHAAIGMTTEVGEFMDMLKKHIFYGKPLDFPNAIEELGDQQWYMAIAIDVLKTTLNDVLTINIDKLRHRYPEKFCEVAAENRDLEGERQILKDGSEKSLRGKDWEKFSSLVAQHIEEYTVRQYGDRGEDQVSEYSASECMRQASKYCARFGKNVREGQQAIDFFKAAHYIQMAAFKFFQEPMKQDTEEN